MLGPPECDCHGKSVRVSAGILDGLQDFIDLVFHPNLRYCQSLIGLVLCAVGNRCLSERSPCFAQSRTGGALQQARAPSESFFLRPYLDARAPPAWCLLSK
ncbi:hypothetical protein CGLO_00338 [Colletotrichum gloeosporioides Cg-14]|uniref:Uncharacterized protein n=1 Tax=Colletotrichum gloeosporioides (strain Cg-14) TaxID=1237896 RepID=T0KUT3_COLGC|nr:hypothetical protein CGLO_00338 [Colletotrichum gloeosporioides Cg-14]